MHPVSDTKDICPPKFGYNFSKIKRKEPELRTSIEDFLQPKDQTHERKIGYNAGHIRTVLQLDTFGPSHSDHVHEGRMSGKLPMSPNLDRNRNMSSGPLSDTSSGMWGDDSTVDSCGSKSVKSRIMFGGTWNKDMLNATNSDKSLPLVRPSTTGYEGQDAHGGNLNYSKNRTAMLKGKAEDKQRLAAYRKDKSRQSSESVEYQGLIDDFEAHLKAIQY
jgi:hypothetical protein